VRMQGLTQTEAAEVLDTMPGASRARRET
jgi:hypothetical protein